MVQIGVGAHTYDHGGANRVELEVPVNCHQVALAVDQAGLAATLP
jgi:hypothetical protein